MARNKRKNNKGMAIGIIIVAIIIVVGGAFIYSSKASTKKDDTTQQSNKPTKQVEKPKVEAVEKINNKYGYPEQGSNIIKSAESYAVPANEVFKMVSTSDKVNNQKEVFLTFDDGPSENTPKILKILKENDVHATFFVMGNNLKDAANREYLKEEYESGNAIGNHTYSHNYHKLYPKNSVNVDAFMKEITQTDKEMRNILGDSFNTRVLRMPGGYMSRKYYHDKNLPAFNNALQETNIVSIDWDAETGDATGKKMTVNQMVEKAASESKNENHVILLMHDAAAKQQTVNALPSIIKYYKDNGYKFMVISNSEISQNK